MSSEKERSLSAGRPGGRSRPRRAGETSAAPYRNAKFVALRLVADTQSGQLQ
jgi:hypothetical protein